MPVDFSTTAKQNEIIDLLGAIDSVVSDSAIVLLQGIESAVDSLEIYTDGVESALALIETELNGQGVSLDALVVDASAIETELLDQGLSLDALVTDAAAIETELLDQGASLDALVVDAAAIESELIDQGLSLDALVVDAAAIETELLDQGVSLDALVVDAAAIETELLSQGLSLDAIVTDAAAIETELLDQGTTLDAIAVDAAAIETELLDQGTSLDALVADASAIETELLDQGTTLDTINSKISTDAFSRIRVSDPVTLFDSKLLLNEQPLLWETTTNAGGSTAYQTNEAALQLSVSTGATDYAIRESHGYIPYNPGKGQLVEMTGVFGTTTSNVTKRIGQFNDDDGLFFEDNGTNIGVVVRTSTSGSPVDTRVAQSSWNIDAMDGNGPSGITADWTKTQIFMMSYQWLGVGQVVFALNIDGNIWPVHEVNNANNLTAVYMARADLPLRFEIRNTAASAGSNMKQICCSAQSEGGEFETRGFVFGWEDGVTTKTVSTSQTSVVAFRLATTFNSKTNRGIIKPISLSIRSSADIWVKMFVAQAHLTETTTSGGTWNPVDAQSMVEYNNGITSYTETQKTKFSDFVVGSNKGHTSLFNELGERYTVALNAAGTTSDIVHIVAQSFGGNASVSTNFTWREIY